MSYLKSLIYELLTICHIWVTYNLSYRSYLQSVIYELLTVCHIWVTYNLSYMSYLQSVIYELLTSFKLHQNYSGKKCHLLNLKNNTTIIWLIYLNNQYLGRKHLQKSHVNLSWNYQIHMYRYMQVFHCCFTHTPILNHAPFT